MKKIRKKKLKLTPFKIPEDIQKAIDENLKKDPHYYDLVKPFSKYKSGAEYVDEIRGRRR